MKKAGIIFICLLTNFCFAQNRTTSLLSSYKAPVDVNMCYKASPALVMHALPDQVVFRSTDGGASWSDLSKGLPIDIEVSNVLGNGGGLYIGTLDGKLYHNKSTETSTWELQTIEGKTTDGFISGIFEGNSCTYASVYQEGFYRQVAGTNLWKSMNGDLENKFVFEVQETTDGAILVGTQTGIYKSLDDGKTWKHVYTKSWVNSMAYEANILVAHTDQGLIRSNNNGESWNTVLEEVAANFELSVIDGYFVAIRMVGPYNGSNNHFSYITISVDGGITWKNMDAGNPADSQVYDLEKVGEYIYSSRVAGISRSNDMGKTWQLLITPPVKKEPLQFEIVVSDSSIFAIARRGCC